MDHAFAHGLIAASSLVLGAVLCMYRPVPKRVLGVIMAFGSGVLLSSVAYELVGEAYRTSVGDGALAMGLIGGALTFFIGDLAIARHGGGERMDPDGPDEASSALAIVLGTVLDGIPESLVIGVGLASGATSGTAMSVAVFLSNVPEAMAGTAGLLAGGWAPRRLIGLWSAIAVASGFAAALGYTVFQDATPKAIAFVLAYAGGAILTMLADTMMPEAFEDSGPLGGVVTTIGFGAGFALAALT